MTFFQKLSYVDAVFRRFLLAGCVGVFSQQIFPRRIGRARLESANLEPDRRFGLISAAFRVHRRPKLRLFEAGRFRLRIWVRNDRKKIRLHRKAAFWRGSICFYPKRPV